MADCVMWRVAGLGHLVLMKRSGRYVRPATQAAFMLLREEPTTGQSASLHARHVGCAVGFSGRDPRDVKTRQARGFAFEAQVPNLE